MLKTIFYIITGLALGWGGYNLSLYGYDLYKKGLASESWEPITADVERFKYIATSTRGGRRHRPRGAPSNPAFDIIYHYEHDGKRYRGDKTGFGPYSTGQLDRPKRGKITVHYNPNNPSESVYIKGVSKPNLGGLAVSIGMILFGFISLCAALRRIFFR